MGCGHFVPIHTLEVSPRHKLRVLFCDPNSPKLTSLCEKSPGSGIGRRNRLPHHDKPSSYTTVGQAVSPVERLFTQTLTHGARPTSEGTSLKLQRENCVSR